MYSVHVCHDSRRIQHTDGFERWHGGNGYGQLNEEGRVILQCGHMVDFAICNTLYNKKDEH